MRNSLSKDGTWMIVEPFANDELKDNLNPVGRVYYSFSTLLCTPCSRAQEVALCLGAQSGEKRIREVVTAAGFSRFRRAAETSIGQSLSISARSAASALSILSFAASTSAGSGIRVSAFHFR